MNPDSPSGGDVPRLRDRLRHATAAAILEAAEKVFAADGVNTARMNDIAAQAGVAVGTLYNHFKDRDALLSALVEARWDELLDNLDAALDAALAAEGDFRVRLDAVLEAFFGFYRRKSEFFSVYLHSEMGKFASCPGAMHVSIGRIKELYRRIEALIQGGLESGALRPEGARVYPVVLMGSIRGLMMRDRFQGIPFEPEDIAAIARCFLEGAAAPAPASHASHASKKTPR